MATAAFPKKPPAPLNATPVPYAPRDLETRSYLPEIFIPFTLLGVGAGLSFLIYRGLLWTTATRADVR